MPAVGLLEAWVWAGKGGHLLAPRPLGRHTSFQCLLHPEPEVTPRLAETPPWIPCPVTGTGLSDRGSKGAIVEVRRLRGLGEGRGGHEEGPPALCGRPLGVCFPGGMGTVVLGQKQEQGRVTFQSLNRMLVDVKCLVSKPYPHLSSSHGPWAGDISKPQETTRLLAYLGQQGAPFSLLHPPLGQVRRSPIWPLWLGHQGCCCRVPGCSGSCEPRAG